MIKEKIKNIIRQLKKKEKVQVLKCMNDKKVFEGKVALITGGTGGIGVEIAKELISCGCKVVIGGTNINKLQKLKEEYGDDIDIIVFNFLETENIEQKIMEASLKFGKIDIFVSSAGVHTVDADFFNINIDEYDKIMDINLKGTFFACQAIAKYMIENRIKGKILLVSSSRGSEPAWSPYGLSKWGIKGFTLGLAQQLITYGIVVNAIAPGSTATDLLGFKDGDSLDSDCNKCNRLISPIEIAAISKLLLSDIGNMIVGETIHISGGRGLFDIR